MPRSTRCVPIQAIPRILTEGAKEAIKYFHNGNKYVELQHGLASYPVVEFSNGYGAEDLSVDEPDKYDLHYGIKMSEKRMLLLSKSK